MLNNTVAKSPATVDDGTIVRLVVASGPGVVPKLLFSTVVGAGFAERTDPNALVVGPTGLAVGNQGQLYVADTVNSRIAVIPFALFRFTAGTRTGVSRFRRAVVSTDRSG